MSNFRFFSIYKKNDETTFFFTFHAHFRNPRLKLPFPAKFKKNGPLVKKLTIMGWCILKNWYFI